MSSNPKIAKKAVAIITKRISMVSDSIAMNRTAQPMKTAIPETLKRTHLSQYQIGQSVHIERSAKFGDEIGGHILS